MPAGIPTNRKRYPDEWTPHGPLTRAFPNKISTTLRTLRLILTLIRTLLTRTLMLILRTNPTNANTNANLLMLTRTLTSRIYL